MKTAKIITCISIAIFLYSILFPEVGLKPLIEILNSNNVDISLILDIIKFTPIAALILNLGFLAILVNKSLKSQELKYSTLTSLLLLIIPIGLFYLSILFVNYKIYNLSY